MKTLIGILSLVLVAQGTMSTDDTDVSQAEASLSGTSEELEIQEEEVQIDEEVDDNFQEEKATEETTLPPSQ
jgi:ABC-type phosphate transport system auxiliary subunit